MTTRSRARILAVLGAASLSLALFAPVAHAQVGAVTDTVGAVTDTVNGGGGSGTSSGGSIGVVDPIGGGGSTSEASEDGGQTNSNPSLVGGVTDGIKKTIEKTQETVEETSGPVGNDVTETVGSVGGQVGNTAGDTVDSVTKTLPTTTLGTNKSRDDKPRSTSTSPQGKTRSGDSTVLGTSFADAMRGDSRVIAAGTSPALRDLELASSVTAASGSIAEQLGLIAQAAAEQMAFPALLMAIVIGFLMVQNRIDRRDPKLAMAPVDSEHDLLSFS